MLSEYDNPPPGAPMAVAGPDDTGGNNDAWFYGALGLAAGLAIALGIWFLSSDDTRALTRADVDAAVAEALQSQPPVVAAPELMDENTYGEIERSVVLVRAVRVSAEPDDTSNGAQLGAGVVFAEDGRIITANHVVSGAAEIELVFADGTTSAGQLMGSSPGIDIAVVAPIGAVDSIVPATFGSAQDLAVGDAIYTVGNPLGLTGSLSAGVVSGLNRSIPFPGDSDLVLRNLIQFDAAVNQGSSGGPLVDAQGQVVGIVTSLADPAGQGFFIGIGFAVPIDIAAAGAQASG